MSASSSRRPSSLPNRFQPEVESLADRIVPTCTVTEKNGILTVVGDGRDNLIIIRDNGGTAASSIIIECDLNSYASKSSVRTLRVLTGVGNDRVNYDMGGNLGVNGTRRLFFDLGGGTLDRFRGDFNGNVSAGAMLSLTVLGGEGIDRIQVDLTQDVDVNTGGVMKMRLLGGGDQDRITVDAEGDIDGMVKLIADGGDSFDSIRQRLSINSNSTGFIRAQSLGGAERDFVDLFARFETGNAATFKFLIDGGSGDDVGRHTFNVRSINVESDRAGV